MSKKNYNIDSLDFLKCIAAILIVFHHYQQVFKVTFNGINFYGGRLYFGYLVELFFMISGYLTLYTSKCITANSTSQILVRESTAFIHKLRRIYPMAIITTSFCLCIKTIDAKVMSDTAKLTEMWNAKALIANFLLLFRGWPGLRMIGYDNPMWYLCILIQCYIVFYFIRTVCELAHNRGYLNQEQTESFAWLIIIILVTLLCKIKIIPYDLYRGLQAFGVGLIVCKLFNVAESKFMSHRSGLKRAYSLLALFMCAVAIISIILTVWNNAYQREILIAGVFIPTLAIAFIYKSWANKVVMLMGKTSFEVFIWHYPLMALIQLIFHLIGNESFRHSYPTMIVFTLFVELWAWLMYTQLEVKIAKSLKEKTVIS